MSQAEHVIGLLGGLRSAADLLGAPLTTVQSWRDGGFIPSRRMRGILDAANKAGIKLEPADFFVDDASSTPSGQIEHTSAA